MLKLTIRYLFYLSLALLLFCPARAHAAENTLTAAEAAQGWRLLFDGKTLTGWKTTGRPAGWVVDEGTILCTVQGGDYLRTLDQFDNFELALEFKLAPKTNSGIRLRSVNPDNMQTRGLEVQIFDSFGKKKPDRHDCGALYDCVAPVKNVCRPAGEWNSLRITCDGSKITVMQNGERITEMDVNQWSVARQNPDGTPNKFPVACKYMARKGCLALQDHGGRVWFRNIKLRPLPAPEE